MTNSPHSARYCHRGLTALGLLLGVVAPCFAQPELQTEAERQWFRNVKQLTRKEMGLDRSGEAYFSPDGQKISFQAYPPGEDSYQIYVMNVSGTGLKMISTGQGACTCSFFHPDGKRVLFSSNHLDPAYARRRQPHRVHAAAKYRRPSRFHASGTSRRAGR